MARANTNLVIVGANGAGLQTGSLAEARQARQEREAASGGGGGGGGSRPTSSGPTPGRPEGPAVPTLQILGSPSQQWFVDPKTGLYYVQYDLPGGGGSIIFEAEPEQIEALFPEGPPEAAQIDFNEHTRQENIHFAGNVAEMEGEGSFEEEYQRTITLALETQNLPDWIKEDQKALDALFVSITEGRSDDWFYNEISKLESFKARYPGVDELVSRGMSISEAVRAHTEYEIQLKALHAAAGFPAEGVTPEHVGKLISNGYSIQQVQDSYSVWKRMNENASALEAFNEVLVAQGKEPLSGTDMYEFLEGNASSEIYDIYEAAALTEAAAAADLAEFFDAEEAIELALSTSENLTVDQAYQHFSNIAAQALRFRHELNVQSYGIEMDDLIDLSFGRAPRSGKSAAEVGEILSKITQQAAGFLKERVTPFFGFTEKGRPVARSFGELHRKSV